VLLFCSPVGLLLPGRLGAGVWQCRSPPGFSSLTCYGEALCWLGVCGVRVLLILGGFFLPSMAPASQQNF
jgi:hypothetical protein